MAPGGIKQKVRNPGQSSGVVLVPDGDICNFVLVLTFPYLKSIIISDLHRGLGDSK